MASLVLTLSDLYTRVSTFLGLTTGDTAPTGDDLTLCKNICYRGYRQFLYPVDARTGERHEWSFLKQLHVLPTVSGKWKYDLPLTFGDLLAKPHFDADDSYNELMQITPGQVLELRAASTSSGFPLYFTIAPYTFDDETGTGYEMWFDPTPDGVYTLQFYYRLDPLKPENAGSYLVGGMKASEAILESCLSVAEQQEDDVIGIHTQLANELTQKLIITDIKEESDFLGNMASPKEPKYRWKSMADPALVYEDEGGVA
jgi:hypothetical protein